MHQYLCSRAWMREEEEVERGKLEMKGTLTVVSQHTQTPTELINQW